MEDGVLGHRQVGHWHDNREPRKHQEQDKTAPVVAKQTSE